MNREKPDAKKLMGCELAEQEAKTLVMEKFPGKPYCLVDGWEILDLEVTETEETALREKGLQPTVIGALWVVYDSKGRFQPGTRMRSSFQKGFDGEFLFETVKTVYVLMGPGRRIRNEIR